MRFAITGPRLSSIASSRRMTSERRTSAICRGPSVGRTSRSSVDRTHSMLRSLLPSRARYSAQIAPRVSRSAALAACAGSTPDARSLSHSLARALAPSRVIAPTLPRLRAVGLGEPKRATNRKDLAPVLPTRTAKPGTIASHTSRAFGAGFNAVTVRSVSGRLASMSPSSQHHRNNARAHSRCRLRQRASGSCWGTGTTARVVRFPAPWRYPQQR